MEGCSCGISIPLRLLRTRRPAHPRPYCAARSRRDERHIEHRAGLPEMQREERQGNGGGVSRRTVNISGVTIISVQSVGRVFGDRELLREVSFRLGQGDRVGLVGPNGTGKTTLLRITAGLQE